MKNKKKERRTILYQNWKTKEKKSTLSRKATRNNGKEKEKRKEEKNGKKEEKNEEKRNKREKN